MLVAERRAAEARGLEPMARLAGFAVTAVEPDMFGLAPVSAVKLAVNRAGWNLDDVDRFEINEAYAAIAIIIARELGLDSERVNVDGGAIAHGHPIGATGAILTTRLLHAMRRHQLRRGVVTLCIGGGQGIALALEAL
jgi:acetyl-CoA C-acetyltransferase